jgi:agmatine deiminase
MIPRPSRFKPIPEFQKPKGVAVVYPKGLPTGRDELIGFFDSFVDLLIRKAELSEIAILYRRGLKKELTRKFPDKRIRFIAIPSLQDIWIKDWAPIAISSDRAIKAHYHPAYLSQGDHRWAEGDDRSGFELCKTLGLRVIPLEVAGHEIVLDGGNFIHNGQGTAITTNRIIADNENLFVQQIRDAFRMRLNIENLLIIPVEPGDRTGHVDGIVRFITENKVVVATYPESYKEGKKFTDTLAKFFKKTFQVFRVSNGTPSSITTEGIPSAFGNYLNYLRIGKTIFLPQYGIKEDEQAKRFYKKFFDVIEVRYEIDKLAHLGGVLNCITWIYY